MAKETKTASRGGRRESLCFAAIKGSALAQAPPAARAATDCPAAPRDHVPCALRDEKLSIGSIQKRLLDYHRGYGDIEIVTVFDMARALIEQNGTELEEPALLFVTDESRLQTGLNRSRKNSDSSPAAALTADPFQRRHAPGQARCVGALNRSAEPHQSRV
jgi:hypothetical protein